MGWFKQLRLLLWKNFLVQYRRKLSTVFEILLPIFFVFILLILRITTIKSDHHDAEGWPPFQLNRTIPIDKAHIQQASPPYAIDKWTIAFAPNSSETNQIMSKLSLFLDANIRAFESADKMVRAVVTDEEYQIQAQTFLCGVSFTSVDSSAGVAYDLRFPTSARSTYGGKRLQKFLNIIPQKWYTQFVYPISFAGINPRNEFKSVGGPPPYYHEGFLSVQHAVDMAIIKTKAPAAVFNESLVDVQLQRFPYPETIRDNFIIVIQSSLPLLLVLSLVYTSLVIVKNIVHEKERRLKVIECSNMHQMLETSWEFLTRFP